VEKLTQKPRRRKVAKLDEHGRAEYDRKRSGVSFRMIPVHAKDRRRACHMFLRCVHRPTLAYADTSGYARSMHILGIETSCDETAVALIDATGESADFHFELLGHGLYSQAALHAPYGGVFPNLAKREHAKNLVPMLMHCLTQAQVLHSAEHGAPT